MFKHIITFSVKQPMLILLLVAGMAGFGIYSAQHLALDAVPDITNNQVQVITSAPTLAAQEVEQYITAPLERYLANLPGLTELRSISRYGLSVITVVFEEDIPILHARQLTQEQLNSAQSEIPEKMGTTELMPITTGLGEIYQYVVQIDSGYEQDFDPLKLRTLQDWVIKRQLSGISGIIEVSSFGGFVKQYELALDPNKLAAFSLSVKDVYEALNSNNSNSASSYIAHRNRAYYIRTEGMMRTKKDIEQTVIAIREGTPILARQLGVVEIGSPPRYGAMTMDGKGEVVGGITLMLKDAHASEVLKTVKKRIETIELTLPAGVHIYPYLDRSTLIGSTIKTVFRNLLEGGLIVIAVLILMLGNIRAGLIVASVIPLAMLFAVTMMQIFGVSANLMSLGAIDFGIVVDGAVITVEGILHTLVALYAGKQLSRSEIKEVIIQSGARIVRPATFGVFIILVVFIPVLTLEGIEGKMFRPMAQTLGFALIGALLLTLTYVPAISSLALSLQKNSSNTLSDRLVNFLQKKYMALMNKVLHHGKTILLASLLILLGSLLQFTQLGREFIPTLEEGDLAMQLSVSSGSTLTHSIENTTKAEQILLEHFPEVKHVVSKIGTAEVPTDPMGIEDADIMILMKDKSEWTSASTRDEMVSKMKEKLSEIDASIEFTQPIQLRFNELISGAKSDVSVQIFGENTDILKEKADEAAEIIQNISGAADVKTEVTQGLQQWVIRYRRDKIAIHGVSIDDLNQTIRAAFAGEGAGVIYEEERKFELVVRFSAPFRQSSNLHNIFVKTETGHIIPVSECAEVIEQTGPNQISRSQSRRKIQVGVNVRGRDLGGLVEEIKEKLSTELILPEGYYIAYGGQFANMERARKRLSIALPISLLLICIFLYAAFNSIKQTIVIFTAIPFAAIGGIWALTLRDLPFSISAGIGFIALFGVAVLNGIVMVSHMNTLKEKGNSSLKDMIIQASGDRLRPVLITALVAALGFLPMALSTGSGAEVQRPLATVVIGGLISSTLLTLLILPIIMYLTEGKKKRSLSIQSILLPISFIFSIGVNAQDTVYVSSHEAVSTMLRNNHALRVQHLEKDRALAMRSGAFSAGSTQFDIQRGQINFEGNDTYFSIYQDLGNPFEMYRRLELAQEAIGLSTAETEMLQRQLTTQVRLKCNEMLYLIAKEELTDSLIYYLNQMRKAVQAQRNAGLLSTIEAGIFDFQYQDWSTSLTRTLNEIAEVQAQLQILLGIKKHIVITEDFSQIQSTANGAKRNQLFADLSLLQLRLLNKEQELIKSSRAPSFGMGYFNQSLDLVPGFRGFALNVSMPLFQREIKAKSEITQIVYEQKLLETEQKLLEYDIHLAQMLKQYEATITRLEEFDTHHSILPYIIKQRESGVVDALESSVAIQQFFQNQLNQLELIRQLNHTILSIQYYVQE